VHLFRCTISPTRCPTLSSGITHSLCTWSSRITGPLYDWLVGSLIDAFGGDQPQQNRIRAVNLITR